MAVYGGRDMDRRQMERFQEMHRYQQPAPPEIQGDIPKTAKGGDMLSGLLQRIFPEGRADSDVLLTAALIWLLYREKADMKLILALAYILL